MKLDMSLIQNDNPDSDRNILEFSMHLAKMMRLQTVAEGVETEAQVKRIISLGGDYIQGYYYGRPSLAEGFLLEFCSSFKFFCIHIYIPLYYY